MNLSLEIIGLPHCPRNRSHAILKKGKASFLGKTEAARSYEKAVLFHLAKYKEEIESFRKKFDPKKHHLHATWELYSPDVLTKDGKYSENGVDLDAHKVLQDTVFGCLGIDDAYVGTDTRSKWQGEYHIYIELQIKHNDGSDLL